MRIILASRSGCIGLTVEDSPEIRDTIASAKRKVASAPDGHIYLDEPLMERAVEDERGELAYAEARSLIRLWAGQPEQV